MEKLSLSLGSSWTQLGLGLGSAWARLGLGLDSAWARLGPDPSLTPGRALKMHPNDFIVSLAIENFFHPSRAFHDFQTIIKSDWSNSIKGGIRVKSSIKLTSTSSLSRKRKRRCSDCLSFAKYNKIRLK